MSCFQYLYDEEGNAKYSVFEIPISKRKGVVQFYKNNQKNKWEMMSLSKVPICNLMQFFKDFEFIDKNELHIRKFIDIEENAISEKSKYHKFYEQAENF